jgi:hypothetical protein
LTITILLAAVAAAGVVVWLLWRRRHQRTTTPTDPFQGASYDAFDHDLERLAAGAVVTIDGSDFVVRGSIRLDENGYTWAEHLLDDTRQRCWLAVENDEGLSVIQWWRRNVGEVDGTPGDRSVTLDGTTYTLSERGTAAFTAEGTTGTAPSGACDYADYASDDGALLSFERFGTDWEVSTGAQVNPRSLTIYPSGQTS